MKDIILGIKDYCKDCRHDWHLHGVEKTNGYRPLFFMWEDAQDEEDVWVAEVDWKEGSVWHYIRQRRLAKHARNE